MTQTYFLGANSGNGFCSLYGDFPPVAGDSLHILKSGPGTGKSGFLRRIGQEAEARGMDVHYVLCSGDPDSLDGVFLPMLHQAWVDGTAPHVIEPMIFGMDSDYVNLGSFFVLPFTQEEKSWLSCLNRSYKECYRLAYHTLSGFSARIKHRFTDEERIEVPEMFSSLPFQKNCGTITRRFLSAITCKGLISLDEERAKLCERTMPVDASTLYVVSEEGKKKGLNMIVCPSPLEPSVIDAVLFPDASLAFVSDSPVTGSELPEEALNALKEAKSLHDQLEAVYHSHMDFAALTAYTEQVVRQLFA